MLFAVFLYRGIHFLTVNVIGILHDTNLLCSYLTDNTDTKSRSREWLTEDKFLRDAKLQTRFADFIFEEVAQRLDDFLEIHIIRETADVVVGLDHCGFSAKSGLYHIRVDGSLCQEIHGSDLLCLFLEDTDKFLSDNFTFFSGSVTPASFP